MAENRKFMAVFWELQQWEQALPNLVSFASYNVVIRCYHGNRDWAMTPTICQRTRDSQHATIKVWYAYVCIHRDTNWLTDTRHGRLLWGIATICFPVAIGCPAENLDWTSSGMSGIPG